MPCCRLFEPCETQGSIHVFSFSGSNRAWAPVLSLFHRDHDFSFGVSFRNIPERFRNLA